MYPNYLPLYQQGMAKKTAFRLELSGTHSGNDYNVTVTIHKLAAFMNPGTVLHVVVTQSHIYCQWQGQDSLQYAERTMVPDANGTAVDMTNDTVKQINLSFTADPSWVVKNLEISAFLQDPATKEIFNGNKGWLLDLITTGINDHKAVGNDQLYGAYPNPMVAVTTIPAIIHTAGYASVNVYDFAGQQVRTLYQGNLTAGRHDFTWNGTDNGGNQLPGGVYFCRMVKDNNSWSQKILINR